MIYGPLAFTFAFVLAFIVLWSVIGPQNQESP